jgi:nicotinate-nucleotide pyrophosphorylase (carboxylating)
LSRDDTPAGAGIQQRLLLPQLYAMLEEDVGHGDITTEALVSPNQQAHARIVARQPGVVAGLTLASLFLGDLGVTVTNCLPDGSRVAANAAILDATGPAGTLLTVERTVLNLLMRMSGIATQTAAMVAAAHRVNPQVRIAATRKTAPLLRIFDKLAVIAGGGDPHRWRLDDAVLIKDNHLALVGDIVEAVKAARRRVSFTKLVEVEARSTKEALAAAQAGADAVLLDNMTPADVSATVKAIRQVAIGRQPSLEASGNITLETVSDYAATGVDVISAGSLTHSVPALDLALDVTPASSVRRPKGRER